MNDTAPVDEHRERQPILHSPHDEPDRHWEISGRQDHRGLGGRRVVVGAMIGARPTAGC